MTAYRAELGPAAARAFGSLEPGVRDRVRRALEKLARDVARPGRVPGKSVKTIHGAGDAFHRLRIGNYRVMYDVLATDQVVLVLGIIHRGDLDRWLRRR